jgi:hypothetical protein
MVVSTEPADMVEVVAEDHGRVLGAGCIAHLLGTDMYGRNVL